MAESTIETNLAAIEVHKWVKIGTVTSATGIAGVFATLLFTKVNIVAGTCTAGLFMIAKAFLLAKFAKQQKYLEEQYNLKK